MPMPIQSVCACVHTHIHSHTHNIWTKINKFLLTLGFYQLWDHSSNCDLKQNSVHWAYCVSIGFSVSSWVFLVSVLVKLISVVPETVNLWFLSNSASLISSLFFSLILSHLFFGSSVLSTSQVLKCSSIIPRNVPGNHYWVISARIRTYHVFKGNCRLSSSSQGLPVEVELCVTCAVG